MAVRVSLAMPVYNGEKYIEEAIRSILVQDFADFELIITDNASTDRTEAICRSFAASDSRIHYVRNARNLGAAPNYNLGFELARGEFLKWCAHDDWISPNCIGECVRALDENPGAVMAYPATQCIDEFGHLIETVGAVMPDMETLTPARRFFSVVSEPATMFEIFGLFRRDALATTVLHGSYYGSDRALMAEAAILGRFVCAPRATFYNREHRLRSINIVDKKARAAWQNTDAKKAISMEHWNLLVNLFSIAGRHTDVASPLVARAYLIEFALRPRQISRYLLEFFGMLAPGGPTQVRAFVQKFASLFFMGL